MDITNKQYMRTLINLVIGLSILSALTACGGDKGIDAQKAKLEKLKASQAEIADQIKSLEQEIASSGDTIKTNKKMKDVLVMELNPTAFSHSIDVQGRVEGDENVTLNAKMAGTVTKVNVTAGSHVSAGQVMAEIESQILQAQLADLKTSYSLAKDVYNKQKSLWDQKIGTEMQYLQAKNNKESLEQKINQLNETLEMYKIKAPFSGTVDEVTMKVGQTVAPGAQAAIRVVNLAKLKVRADLAESYAASIHIGDKVNLIFPDINKQTVSSVTYSGKVINPMTRTFTVEINLPGDEDYRPNMVVQVGIVDYIKKNVIVVPVNTIQSIEGKDFVYVAVTENGMQKAVKKEVKVGAIYNGSAEILNGLETGEKIITTGYSNLNDGELIRF
jgi:RND family efflux transporter MFP subunit